MRRSPKWPRSYLIAQGGVIEVALNGVVVVILCASPSLAGGVNASVLTVGSLFSGFFRNVGRGFRPVGTLEALIGVNILLGLNVPDDEVHCAEGSVVVVIRCVQCVRYIRLA